MIAGRICKRRRSLSDSPFWCQVTRGICAVGWNRGIALPPLLTRSLWRHACALNAPAVSPVLLQRCLPASLTLATEPNRNYAALGGSVLASLTDKMSGEREATVSPTKQAIESKAGWPFAGIRPVSFQK